MFVRLLTGFPSIHNNFKVIISSQLYNFLWVNSPAFTNCNALVTHFASDLAMIRTVPLRDPFCDIQLWPPYCALAHPFV